MDSSPSTHRHSRALRPISMSSCHFHQVAGIEPWKLLRPDQPIVACGFRIRRIGAALVVPPGTDPP